MVADNGFAANNDAVQSMRQAKGITDPRLSRKLALVHDSDEQDIHQLVQQVQHTAQNRNPKFIIQIVAEPVGYEDKQNHGAFPVHLQIAGKLA
ncbi:hypothetical protein D3C87_1844090 [compost metagenome]